MTFCFRCCETVVTVAICHYNKLYGWPRCGLMLSSWYSCGFN